jgi:hypothetical protein
MGPVRKYGREGVCSRTIDDSGGRLGPSTLAQCRIEFVEDYHEQSGKAYRWRIKQSP